jgi:hypothetical protein
MTRYPVIDEKRGGSLAGILKTLNHLSLDVAVPRRNEEAGTYIVPGHGRICDRYDIAIYRDMLTIIRDRIQDLVKKGQTIEQVKAAKPTYDYDGEFGAENGRNASRSCSTDAWTVRARHRLRFHLWPRQGKVAPHQLIRSV